jgi:hypothetical protein
MSCKAAHVLLSAIAPSAATVLMVISTGPADAATACNAAPKSPPPQGSHWYYRTDRSLGRKCWYLASAGQKTQQAAPQIAAPARATPAPETDHAAADETPASQLTLPARLVTRERIATPTEQAAPPEAEPLQTRLARASVAEQADAAPSVPATQAAANEAAFNLLEERRAQLPASPPPAVSTSVAEADPSSISLFQILLISFMAACLLASAVLHMLRASRRRREVRTVDLNDQSPLRKRAAIQAAALRAPPADVVEIDDETLRAFGRSWRQHAA